MCSIITRENLESSNRPDDGKWSNEENARYTKGRAEAIRLADERQKGKQIQVYRLTDGKTVYTFWIDTLKAEAEIASRARYGSTSEEPRHMSIEDARQEWQQLVDSGFSRC